MKAWTLIIFSLASILCASAQQCGSQAGGALCHDCLCCSQWGFCGSGDAWCGTGCQSQCDLTCAPPPPPPSPPPPPPSPPPPSPPPPSPPPPPPPSPPPPPPPQQCGSQAGGALCPNCLCCSQWGFCGSGDAWCGTGCQSQCDLTCAPPPPPSPPPPPPPPYTPPPPPTPCGELTSLISRELFEQMLLHRNNAACPARGFYTYDNFIAAAKSFEGFAQGDDSEICKREIAAFLGQTSHETTGGWDTAPDGRFAWGYCFKEEVGAANLPYCVQSVEWPCVAGKKYYGRGPIQISYNYNYGPAGQHLGVDLLSDPDLVASDGLLSFKTAFWFWMTPQAPKPSCHDVMIGNWTPSPIDIAAGRLPGYGLCTNIINGGLECGGTGPDERVESRIGFYKRYCDLLGVSYGDNLDCYNMNPYGFGLSSVHANQVLDPVM